MRKDDYFDKKQARKQADKARTRDQQNIEKRTHKWVRTQYGMKLVKQ